MTGIQITNCLGETFCVSSSFLPPSPTLQTSQISARWGSIKQFQSAFCVEHFLATLSDVDLQAICFQFTPSGELNRQLLEKALLDGELKVHPELPLSDLHLGDNAAASNTVCKPNKTVAAKQTEQRSLITIRAEIKTTLRQILDQEKFDALQLEKQYQQKNSYEKSLAHIKQFATGLHGAGISFLTWLKDVHDVINMNQRLLRIIKAAMAADKQNQGQRYQVFKQTLAESEKKELVEALGFDPAKISVDQLKHVYSLATLIYEDLPTRIMLTQFAKDYANAQHSLEWSEFSGGAAFEVILTALLAIATGGVGAIASLGAQTRKISQLKKLGALLTELAEGLKNLPKEKPFSLRKLKEAEDRKTSKAQQPSEKPAPKAESSSASEKDNVGGTAEGDDGTMRGGRDLTNRSHIPDGISAARFEGLVDEFAEFRSARGFNRWKESLVDEGLTAVQIQEVVYQGSLKRGENLWKGDWKRYYEEISGTQYPGQPSHAHHLVEKGSSSPAAIENRRILEEVGINPLLNRENLTWAPNVTGQHGAIPQGQLLEMLSPVRGDRDGTVNVLQQWAEIAKARN